MPLLVPRPSSATSDLIIPSDLASIVAAWKRLPDPTKVAIAALIEVGGADVHA
jgi:hypothetical protein